MEIVKDRYNYHVTFPGEEAWSVKQNQWFAVAPNTLKRLLDLFDYGEGTDRLLKLEATNENDTHLISIKFFPETKTIHLKIEEYFLNRFGYDRFGWHLDEWFTQDGFGGSTVPNNFKDFVDEIGHQYSIFLDKIDIPPDWMKPF